jgi:hypothetical protein
MYLYYPRKGAEVPDLNALELGQNKYIYGRFGGHMDTINTSAQSGGLRIQLNANTRVPAEVTAFCSSRWINGFEVEVEI